MQTLPDRPMTEAEKTGFRMACACFATWGAQIERAGISLGGGDLQISGGRLMQLRGRFMKDCARALELTLGR